MSSVPSCPSSLRQCFHDFPDPRRQHGRLHSLWDIIALTICATICGCDEVTDIELYGQHKFDFLQSFLDLDNGIPSHDTIGRVFARLDPKQFRACFAAWVESLAQQVQAEGRVIAIDGKSLKGAHAKDASPLHLVSAFATDNRLVLTQQAVGDSNEITAIPELLKLLDVRKAVITIDAMGCQKEIAAQIKAQKGDYVLALKENQPKMHQAVMELFWAGLETDFAGMKHQEYETTDEKGHGRKEKRTYHQIELSREWLAEHEEWVGLKTVGMVFSERQVQGEEWTGETRFYLSSLPLKVKTFAGAVRSHWKIENQLHWVLDVSFREDENRCWKDHTAENLAWIRRVTASLLAREETKRGVRSKRKMAGWDDEYLVKIASQAIA